MRVVVVPCGAAKQDTPQVAGRMYTGGYHKLCRRYADTFNPDIVLILSAKYGFVGLNQVLHPYDTRWKDPDAITPTAMLAQIDEMGLRGAEDVVAIGGVAYARRVQAIWPNARLPLIGRGGMGYQQQYMKQQIEAHQ